MEGRDWTSLDEIERWGTGGGRPSFVLMMDGTTTESGRLRIGLNTVYEGHEIGPDAG